MRQKCNPTHRFRNLEQRCTLAYMPFQLLGRDLLPFFRHNGQTWSEGSGKESQRSTILKLSLMEPRRGSLTDLLSVHFICYAEAGRLTDGLVA